MAARRRFENITELRAHVAEVASSIYMSIFRRCHDDQRPDLVNPMNMVGVRMSHDDAVEPADAQSEQLLAKIRRHVDEDLRLGASSPPRSTRIEQRRRRFLGLFGSQAPQPWPTRGTPPDDPQPKIVIAEVHATAATFSGAGILENKRSALSVVSAAIVCGETPLTRPARARCPRQKPVRCACRDWDGARNGASVSTSIRSIGTSRAISRSSPEFLKVTTPEKET